MATSESAAAGRAKQSKGGPETEPQEDVFYKITLRAAKLLLLRFLWSLWLVCPTVSDGNGMKDLNGHLREQ